MQKLKFNRSLLKYILFTILTLGIYAIYFQHVIARDMNFMCRGDGKRTRGVIAYVIFSLLTFGIYSIVWLYNVGNRINVNSARYGYPIKENGTTLLLWEILGALLFGIGPFVAMHLLIKGYNHLSAAYIVNGDSNSI